MRGKKNEKETNKTLLECVEKIALEAKSSEISKEFLQNNKKKFRDYLIFLKFQKFRQFCSVSSLLLISGHVPLIWKKSPNISIVARLVW